VLALFVHDGEHRRVCRLVQVAQKRELCFEVLQHDALDGDGCRGDSGSPDRTGDEAEDEAADAAQVIAAAARPASTAEFRLEQGPVAFFVALKVPQRFDE